MIDQVAEAGTAAAIRTARDAARRDVRVSMVFHLRPGGRVDRALADYSGIATVSGNLLRRTGDADRMYLNGGRDSKVCDGL